MNEKISIEVPFLDLQAQYKSIRSELVDAVTDVADSTWYVLGPKVASFERDFAAYMGAQHCVAVNSGTSALHLALIAAGVGEGDEVITVPMTFVATTWAISYVGARPVFVDVDPVTYTMDPARVEEKITAQTKAILPVHLYGQSADLDSLLEIGARHGIPVIEDAAQAHGAAYRVGGLAAAGLPDASVFILVRTSEPLVREGPLLRTIPRWQPGSKRCATMPRGSVITMMNWGSTTGWMLSRAPHSE